MVFQRLRGNPYVGAIVSALPWIPVAIFFLDHGYSYSKVTGRSMQPTFNPDSNQLRKDIVLLDRFSVHSHEYRRGQVVMLTSPLDPNRLITKRIIGLPGDMVQPLRKKEKVAIPQGHCWIEGDETFHSRDSNLFGPVPLALIQAKVRYILWPFSRWGPVPDRPIPKDRVKANVFRPDTDALGQAIHKWKLEKK
ncbi:LexA/Signal peptidase [Sporodiniella umbellata]|nr:LexA/Signal peptidase [Sporodiniella umbellata]